MVKHLYALLGLILLLGLSLAGYRFLEATMRAQVYQQRLAEMADAYEGLRHRYNDAVRRTAVTELVVENGRLAVVIRGLDGQLHRIETPFNPAREIYVDYVVMDGRLWIRRVFDQHTSPQQGVVIDPDFLDVDWSQAHADHGKAVYRRLGEGRWVVTVTGDGSLGLRRVEDGTNTYQLQPAPLLGKFEPDEQASENHDPRIRWRDLWRLVAP